MHIKANYLNPAFGEILHNKNPLKSRVLAAHACNPSCSGGRDQEDHGSGPAQANSSRELVLKIPNI
jgi:hypothetical protein